MKESASAQSFFHAIMFAQFDFARLGQRMVFRCGKAVCIYSHVVVVKLLAFHASLQLCVKGLLIQRDGSSYPSKCL